MNVPAQSNGASPLAEIPQWLRQAAPGPRMVDVLDATLGLGAPPTMSIANSRFTLKKPSGDEMVGLMDQQLGVYVDVILIDQLEHRSKIFYGPDQTYDPSSSDNKPPKCFSHNGVAPSTACSEPQHITCGGCPQAEWGAAVSRVTGKGIPACHDYQHVAVLVPGHEGVFLLRVPPSGLKNLKAFKDSFKKDARVDIKDVFTRMWFEPGVVGLLNFAAVGFIDANAAGYRNKLLLDKATDSILARGDKPRVVALAAPVATQQPQQPQLPPPPAQVPGAPPATGWPAAAQPQSSQAPQQPPPQAAPPVEEKPKRARKTSQVPGSPPAAPAAAPFGQAQQPAPAAPQGFAPAPPPPGAAYGIQPGAPPNADVQAAISGVVGRLPGT